VIGNGNVAADVARMLALTREAIERNAERLEEHGDFDIWHAVTRGPGRWAYHCKTPTVFIEILPVPWEWFGPSLEGARAVIARTRSLSSETVDPKIKHHSRLNFNLAELEAGDVEENGWPLLTDARGNLTEGVGYNVFLVSDGRIRTPSDSSILQGVSRGYVFELAAELGIPIVEEDLQPYDLYTADEAFFSSTPFCALPVTAVDRREIGDGKPGPVFERLVAAWSERVGVDIRGQSRAQFARLHNRR
jgi:branched-chain amino acid aminotransferase